MRPRLLFASMCLCLMASAGCIAERKSDEGRDQTIRDLMSNTESIAEIGGPPAGDSTRFFETHPNVIDLEERRDSILFANRQVGLEFRQSEAGFELTRLYGIDEDQEFLTEAKATDLRDLFEIRMTLDPKRVGRDEREKTKPGRIEIMEKMAGDAFTIGPQAGKTVPWRRKVTDSESALHLEWKGIDVREDEGAIDVEVTVTLRAGDPLSYWRIAISNRSGKYGIERVRFPILSLAPIGKAEENVFVYPKWRGGLAENPFSQPAGLGENYHTTGAFYPYYFNMQFQALYNKQSKKGIYLGTRDPGPNLMNIQIINTPSEIAWRPGHFPPNITFAEEDFALPYDCVVGPFRGDWFDACQIYRAWAVEQSWCRKGKLSVRPDIPKWYKEAPLFFYSMTADSAEGTHSAEENLRIGADHFREFLKWAGMRLPASWWSWEQYSPGLSNLHVPFNDRRMRSRGRWAGLYNHNCYDGNYPKIPALPNFSAECKRLREEGGMVSPYVCLQMFDQGPSENSPYADEAKPHMSRDLYGSLLKYGGYHAWLPCVHTQWWRDRMKETCVQLLERENAGGIYLDVMLGCGLPCYWTPHGHSAAGGSSMTDGMHGLAEYIRDAVKARDSEAITTGENAAENMIDVIDGVHYLRTLRSETKAPLFATVYQDYAPRYARELSVADTRREDYFFIECASLFVEGAQVGRLRLRPRNRSLSFQKPEHREMIDFLGRMVGYYRQEEAKKFLVYGQLMRPLEFREPSPMPMLSYNSFDPRMKSSAPFPALMSGVFRSEDGDLGIFVVNASTKHLKFQAELDPTRYGMAADTIVDLDAFAPDGASRQVLSRAKGIIPLKGSLPGHHMTMFRLKSAARR